MKNDTRNNNNNNNNSSGPRSEKERKRKDRHILGSCQRDEKAAKYDGDGDANNSRCVRKSLLGLRKRYWQDWNSEILKYKQIP